MMVSILEDSDLQIVRFVEWDSWNHWSYNIQGTILYFSRIRVSDLTFPDIFRKFVQIARIFEQPSNFERYSNDQLTFEIFVSNGV